VEEAITQIKIDLQVRVAELKNEGKVIEAYRLEQKVNYDVEQIREFGFVGGIENYTRYFDGRAEGTPPFTLLDYFWENQRIFGGEGFLTIVDESHMSVPQVRGMYFGDRSRKENLVKYGFRLPSALDNRPLRFNEFLEKNEQFIFVSATPAEWEIEFSEGAVVEQLLRPTGLVDPVVEVRASEGQIEDLIVEVLKRKMRQERVLITVLTKRMAETLTDYLSDEERLRQVIEKVGEKHGLKEEMELPKTAYLHSDIETLDRSDILADLREGKYDVLVGINLLREGLDLPEVSLVVILDADKEGFLRSETSLIQTVGRAARHVEGRAIMYADVVTGSMKRALEETTRRREFQLQHNRERGIVPVSVKKKIKDKLIEREVEEEEEVWLKVKGKSKKPLLVTFDKKTVIDLNNFNKDDYTPYERKVLRAKLRRKMLVAANAMDFELAAVIRDVVVALNN
jgi:excinuclease ABC subunit B